MIALRPLARGIGIVIASAPARVLGRFRIAEHCFPLEEPWECLLRGRHLGKLEFKKTLVFRVCESLVVCPLRTVHIVSNW